MTAEKKRRVYVDTSAYLAVVFDEPDAATFEAEMADAVLHSSVLLLLEAQRNLVRSVRDKVITPEAMQDGFERLVRDRDLFILRDLDLDLAMSGTMPVATTPRSLDLAHLRTALWFHRIEPIDRFVTKDAAQRQAARELGLPV